jgi:hypothetical protein
MSDLVRAASIWINEQPATKLVSRFPAADYPFLDRVPFRGVRGGAQSLSPAGVAGVRQWAEAASLTI